MGYDGPALSEALPGANVQRVSRGLDHQMALKSDAEVALIRESARWGAHAHHLLQDYTRVGANETEVEARATKEATAAMIAALGDSYRGQNRWMSGAVALYRGQIGVQQRPAARHDHRGNVPAWATPWSPEPGPPSGAT